MLQFNVTLSSTTKEEKERSSTGSGYKVPYVVPSISAPIRIPSHALIPPKYF
ncbi:MAG: hypothetical protein M5T52_23745 [Ignavibacteriaceae bacterium]|nr:hypothetical protein [Ignavibacteriaceae bacterium]